MDRTVLLQVPVPHKRTTQGTKEGKGTSIGLLLSELIIITEYNKFGKLKWHDREIQRLMNAYPINPMKRLKVIFPDRTDKAIKHMARKLGLRKLPRWTEEELELLRQLTDNKNCTWREIASQFPLRTVESVISQYHSEHFKRSKSD